MKPGGGRSREASRWKRLCFWVWWILWVCVALILVISPPSLPPRCILFFSFSQPIWQRHHNWKVGCFNVAIFFFGSIPTKTDSSWNELILSLNLSSAAAAPWFPPVFFSNFPLITKSYFALCTFHIVLSFFSTELFSSNESSKCFFFLQLSTNQQILLGLNFHFFHNITLF